MVYFKLMYTHGARAVPPQKFPPLCSLGSPRGVNFRGRKALGGKNQEGTQGWKLPVGKVPVTPGIWKSCKNGKP